MNVKLNIFEGPLDLLLFLIKKNEIDIYDIPIEQVTKQYLGVLRAMENMSLEIAGEFFVMAATLMYIKSRMLLPLDEQVSAKAEDDEDTDPRWELVEQLLEYQKIKQGAGLLEDLILHRQNYLDRYLVEKEKTDDRPIKPVDRMELWNTFNTVLRRLSEKLVQGEITDENISVADRMEFILSQKEKTFTFTNLVESLNGNLPAVVATFFAMLELTRLRRLKLEQSASFDEIYCEVIDEEEASAELSEDDESYQKAALALSEEDEK